MNSNVTHEWRASNVLRYRSRASSGRLTEMSIQWMSIKGCWSVIEVTSIVGNRPRTTRLAEFAVGIPTPQGICAALTLAMEFVETTQTLRNSA